MFKSGTNNAAKVMSVLAALVLWFHVTAGGTFTTTVSLPIRYIKPVRGLMVASVTPERVLVLVRGSGRALFIHNIKRLSDQDKQYALVNLAGLPEGKNRISIDRSKVFLGVDGLDVESILENADFTVVLDHKTQRTVTVDVDSLPGLRVEKGITVVGRPATEPKYALIEGPASILRTIASVRVASLPRTEVSLSDTVLKAELDTRMNPFVDVQPRKVELRFTVEPLAEKVMAALPVRLKGFPGKRKYIASPESLDVRIQGPASVMARVEREDLSVSVPYDSFLKQTADGGKSVRPEIVYPKGVTGVSPSPETVQVAPREGHER